MTGQGQGAQVLPFRRRQANPDDEPYCRLPYLMEQFNVSESTIRRWTRKGMPSKLIGRVRLYQLGKVRAWIDQNSL